MSAGKQPQVISTGSEIYTAVSQLRQAGKRVGLVPTMGALHAGHLSLVAAARRNSDVVVVSIFVNPTQFGPHEDFSKYPRTLDRDLDLLGTQNVEIVFAPLPDEMYRAGHSTAVEVSSVSDVLEGPLRPGHFRGVATVVLKLFNLAPANSAYFGLKDYQQAMVIRQMTSDLNVPVDVQLCPIVREPDGLAMSSRNVYLSREERQRALTLYRSLQQAAGDVARGERDAVKIMASMRRMLAESPGIVLEYAELADPQTLQTVEQISGPCIALIAARVGKTRLIDNQLLNP